MDRLDGEDPTLELTIRRRKNAKPELQVLGPFPRYLCELMLADAEKREWFVSGRIVGGKREET